MEFHVSVKVHDAIVLDDDKHLRQVIGPRLQHVLESGKVRTCGFLGGMRGAFFVIAIEAPEDLYDLLGPEVYGTCEVQVQPIIPVAKGAELFQRWAQEGR